MVFSLELRIAALIWVLYASSCLVLLYADEGIVQRVFGGLRMRVAEDRLRILGRSLICLNPLLPMLPAFRSRWGDAPDIPERASLPAMVTEALAASTVLAPYVSVVFLNVVIALPVAVLIFGAARALPVLLLAYAAIAIMLIRVWLLRRRFALDGKRFALLAFECLACAPLAPGIVRRLSLAIPLEGDLASFFGALSQTEAARAIQQLARCCGEREAASEEGSPEQERMIRYAASLREYQTRVAMSQGAKIETDAQPFEAQGGPAAENSR